MLFINLNLCFDYPFNGLRCGVLTLIQFCRSLIYQLLKGLFLIPKKFNHFASSAIKNSIVRLSYDYFGKGNLNT